MTSNDGDSRPLGGGGTRGLAVRDVGALVFAADMYGLQLDQLARLTGGERSARAAAARWRELGYAETARLTTGPAWLWVTKAGLAACGLGYAPAKPALSRLAHIRAVAAARIALEATAGYRAGNAFWRCERRIRSRHGVGLRQHLPDAEVHWPDEACGADGAAIRWAGMVEVPPPGTSKSCSRGGRFFCFSFCDFRSLLRKSWPTRFSGFHVLILIC
jgi:hypothetical protein